MIKTHKYIEPEIEIAPDRLPSSIQYLEHDARSELIRWHCHKEYELHLINSTCGTVYIGDHIGTFSAGHIMLLGPNLPHNWISDEDSIIESKEKIRDKVIQFGQNIFSQLNEILPEVKDISHMLNNASHGIEFNCNTLTSYNHMFDAVRDSNGVIRVIKFFELLHALSKDSEQRQLSTRSFTENPAGHNFDFVNRTLNYITKNYMQTISLSDVAQHVGMPSPSHFSRSFHKSTGIKYIDFITNLRISKACELLEKSNDQITQICFEVGFSNVANFNRHFLAAKGMTPRQYREQSHHKFSLVIKN